MANIITTITGRIEEHRKENKNPCKSYKTQEAAEKATADMAQRAAIYFDANGDSNARSADYVVFYVESWGRWVGAINLSQLLNRPNSRGGYVGFCTGFYTW